MLCACIVLRRSASARQVGQRRKPVLRVCVRYVYVYWFAACDLCQGLRRALPAAMRMGLRLRQRRRRARWLRPQPPLQRPLWELPRRRARAAVRGRRRQSPAFGGEH